MTTTVPHAQVGPLAANGTAPIPFDFQAISSDEIEVLREGVVVSAATYTVDLNGDGTGEIIPTSSWGSDEVYIRSAPAYDQPTDFGRFAKWYPDQLNFPLDRMTRMLLALKRRMETISGGDDTLLREDLAALAGAQHVRFSPAGSGAVGRTLLDELRDRSVNVKGFGAVGDGATDESAAFLAAANTGKPIFVPTGEYDIGDGVLIPSGQDLILIGDEAGQVVIKGNQDFNGFKNTSSTPVGRVIVKNITFDGGVTRTTFPYADSIPLNPRGFRSGISLFGDKTDSIVLIESCVFRNFSSLPFLLSYFAHALVTNCQFIRTFDPGFRWCRKIIFSNNLTEFSADNGVSISRGCKHVTVTGNIFKDCEESGVWLSGYGVALTGNVTLTGSYTAGSVVTLTAASANFDSSMIGGYITLINGTDEATVKITETPSSTVANGIAVNAVPASLQAVATGTWNLSPAFGVDGATITGNLIIGCLETGVRGDIAARNFVVNGNTFLRAGWTADSEVATTGTVLSGSSSLVLTDPTDFEIGDFLILETNDSYRDYHIGAITNLVGSTATISPAPTASYIAEVVRKLHVEDGSVDTGNFIVIAGSATGVPDKTAGNVIINSNLMVDAAGSGIVLGGSNGPVSKVTVSGNQIEYKSGVGPYATGNRYTIHMRETIAGSEISHVSITNNMLAGFSNNVRLSQKGATARTGIVVNNNTYTSGLAFAAVNSDAGSAVVTQLYSASSFDKWGTPHFDNIGCTFNTRTPSAGVLTIDRMMNAVAGAVTITDFLRPVGSSLGIFVIRNSNTSGGTDITITHNLAKIRTQAAVDLLIKPGAAAMFAFINDTVAVQIG
jgi:hypothetical protein